MLITAAPAAAIESQKMNVVRATNGSPVFQGKMNELPDIYNLRINKRKFNALYVYFTGKNESGQTSLAIDA
jgi:hypothetical protein